MRKSGLAVLAASLAIAATETIPALPEEINRLPSGGVAQAAEVHPVATTSSTHNHKHHHEKYWYGLPSELHVIKQLGHTANAKLTFQHVKQEPWYSAMEMYCLDRLWFRESKFDKRADNPWSEAYGIPQANPGSKMGAAGGDWASNAKTQIRWGVDDYIEDRPGYRTPCNAWTHSQQFGWY